MGATCPSPFHVMQQDGSCQDRVNKTEEEQNVLTNFQSFSRTALVAIRQVRKGPRHSINRKTGNPPDWLWFHQKSAKPARLHWLAGFTSCTTVYGNYRYSQATEVHPWCYPFRRKAIKQFASITEVPVGKTSSADSKLLCSCIWSPHSTKPRWISTW